MTTQTSRDPGVRTYRGRTLDEIIPKIRSELGPDAIILREREGLTGGLNGFFAQRCVEIEAQAAPHPEPAAESRHADSPEPDTGTPQGAGAAHAQPAAAPLIDVYDDSEPAVPDYAEPARSGASMDALAPPGPAAPARGPVVSGREELSFAERLDRARTERETSLPAFGAAPTTASPVPPAGAAHLDAATAGAVARELVGHGISEAWAHELVVSAAAHLCPLSPDGSLRDAVRAGLAGAISGAVPLPSSGAAVAFVGAGGAGKTHCVAALACAYARHSTLAASVVSLSGGARANDAAVLLDGRDVRVEVDAGPAATDTVARYRDGGLVVVDTVGVSPVDHAGVQALTATLNAFELDAVYLTVPATLSASAARRLLDGLSPLGPTALVITHADEVEELGIATELAYLSGLPIAFVHGGLAIDTALSLADPARVAARLLP